MSIRPKLNPELSIGNLLTATTILISLESVLISWNADRNLKRINRAIEVREAAAVTLANLDRWKDISYSTFVQLQNGIVRAGEMVAAGESEERQSKVTMARDFLWKEINLIRFNNNERILAEKIDTGYVQLLKYFPQSHNLYEQSLVHLRDAEAQMVVNLLKATEQDIVLMERKPSSIQSADLGNKLRKTTDEIADKYSTALELATKQADVFLNKILSSTNAQLADVSEPSKL